MRFASSLILVSLISSSSLLAQANSAPESNSLDDRVKMQLSTLDRKNSVATLKGKVECMAGVPECKFDLRDAHLLDEEHGIRYYLLTENGNRLVSEEIIYLKLGKPMRFWAKFTAPTTEVKKVNIVLNNFEPVEEFSIADK